LVTVGAKIVSLDFLGFEALRAPGDCITFHVCLGAVCGRREGKIDFSTSTAKFKFYLVFVDICS